MSLHPYLVIYDPDCGICQALSSWLQSHDRRQKTRCVPIDAEKLTGYHPSLTLEACQNALHVVTSRGKVLKGWLAVAQIMRLFPLSWPIGLIGSWPPFSLLGAWGYRLFAQNRHNIGQLIGTHCRLAPKD